MNKNWVFFLILGPRLPKAYPQLVTRFLENGATLIPVRFNQYIELSKKIKHSSMVVYEGGSRDKKIFRGELKSHFEFLVKSGSLSLYHISSYIPLDFKAHHKFIANYTYYKLPLILDSLVDDITYRYLAKSLEVEKWPGGKKGRVPDMVF